MEKDGRTEYDTDIPDEERIAAEIAREAEAEAAARKDEGETKAQRMRKVIIALFLLLLIIGWYLVLLLR